MTRHRLEPGRRRKVRPRYGRMGAAGFSLLVTLVALLAGLGVIPMESPGGTLTLDKASSTQAADAGGTASKKSTGPTSTETPKVAPQRSVPSTSTKGAGDSKATRATPATALPSASGEGRRVVFDMSAQRVWLVGADDRVVRSYLVSGSLTHNLKPGSYNVYSRSRWAVGIDDSGDMQYFVRFTRGNNAAIGFHSIPTSNGKMLQTVAQLGTPQSHGCIRQQLTDAKQMWDFAPDGTSVVVTA